MINIEIDRVFWTQNISAGKKGEFGKSLSSGNGVTLRYLGHGVLVECAGTPDRLVPIAQVLTVEASERVTPEEWAGGLRRDIASALIAAQASSAELPDSPPIVAVADGASRLDTAAMKASGGLTEAAAESIEAHREAHAAGTPVFGVERKKPGPKPKA